MKNLLYIFLLLSSSNSLWSQTYYNFPDTGWSQTLLFGIHNGYGWDSYPQELSHIGDTTINGRTFQVISFGGSNTFFIRQENGAIYHDDKLLYDFSLDLGDTLTGYYSTNDTLIVVKKEKLLSTSGDSLWYMELEEQKFFPDTLRWLEGIGSLSSGLLQFFFPDAGFSHICTRNGNNQTLGESPGHPYDCNCDYLHGQDVDHDGFRNYIPLWTYIELTPFDWPPHFAKSEKHRRCDTLVIVNSTGLSVEVVDKSSGNGINADSVTGNLEQLFYYHIADAETILVTHQFSDVYYEVEIIECETQDCNDNNSAIHAGHPEIPYDGFDNDCDSLSLDDDLDLDGFPIALDCNDSNNQINPSITEVVYNGVDDDCDTLTLDDDLDQDSFLLEEDCNDIDDSIYPGASEIPDNGIDEDCDGEDLITALVDLYGQEIFIYPNPTTGVLNINCDACSNDFVFLYDLTGNVIYRQTGIDPIQLHDQAAGIYFLEIKTPDDVSYLISKIVIIK